MKPQGIICVIYPTLLVLRQGPWTNRNISIRQKKSSFEGLVRLIPVTPETIDY